ncbi:dystrophin-like isoform X2 [Mya arenaria]|uniref:dystrophin-like isoform X2 n=1 Tax=Mya arenaria TaxID=6604 RepID=UPI0022E94807|nr:dystrophin-like isoform X2 [Mya arenaria]
MSNISLGGNHGHSINFDGASLQNEQEAEYRKEEEAQQNELRALLSNAFDDLIDDDDILSITSDDGTDSRNVSLVRRHSNDSMGRPSLDDMNKNRIDEQPEQDWTHTSNDLQQHQRSNQGHDPRNLNRIPQPQRARFEPLSRTQELPRGQIDLLRASVESLPAYPSAGHDEIQGHGHGNFDNHSIPSRHGSRDHLDSDYHSNAEDNAQSVEFRGHVYPLPSNQCHSQGQISRQTSHSDTRSEMSDRENTLRKSIEDFEKIKEAYQSHQLPVSIPQGQGHEHGFYSDSEVHAPIATHQHYHGTDQTFDPEQYHYPHPDQNQGQPVHHHGYGEHYHDNPHVHHEDTHHHFRNIYADRPYHTIGERGETEGGNVVLDSMGYYHPGYNQTHVYHGNQEIDQSEQRNQECLSQQTFNGSDPGYFSRVKDKASTILTNTTQQIANSQITNNSGVTTGRKLPQVKYRLQNVQGETKKDQNKGNSNSNSAVPNNGQENGRSHEARERVSEEGSYKVKYERDSGGTGSRKGDRRRVEENSEDVDKDFMDQVGSGDNQQLAQLQILYKARGRKIEELTNEMEVLKSDTSREMRILKHQLSVAKGEKQGSTKSLDSVQSLLQDARGENAQLVGRVNACESQIEGFKRGKEELIKKLQTAESTIETLHQHLEELGSSDTLTRARHDHEVVVGGLQKKYENEIKLLKENIDRLNESAQEKKEENAMLKQKLAESIKEHETAQISRAETINRLTQSLEESQKRCRNLLEASSSQEMSQMKIHLQQALAGRSISDEMCSSLQEEIQDLKEQVQMLESASNLGVSMATTHPTSSTTVFQDGNDSMADLGIKKTLDFDTPQGTPTNVKHISMIHHQHQHHSSADVVTSLKSELERCLVSNKQKRQEVTDLKEELRKVKKDMLEYKQRCERAELLTQEHKRRIADLESCINPGDKMNAIENRLKKDVENLKKEKRILLEDCEELQKRLEEVSNSEEKLTELNRELSRQISDMVKEYDMDKRQAVERAHRASEQVSETSRRKLQQELTIQFDGERSSIIARYEEELNNIREELKTAQDEIDRVKDEYCKLCEDMDKVKATLENEHADKLDKTVAEVKESMQQEIELAKLRTEEDCDKKKEDEIKELKEEFEKVKAELSEKIDIKIRDSNSTALDECREENRRAIEELKMEHEKEVKAAQEKFEAEIKAMKDILEMEKSNDMDKFEKEKSNEIEKLKKVIVDKELYISEKEQLFREKDKLLAEKESMLEKFRSDVGGKSSIIESLKNEYKTNFDSFRQELNDKSEEIEKLREELDRKIKAIEEMNSELANYEKLKEVLKCKNNELEKLRTEMEQSKSEIVAEKSAEIDKLKQELSETVELKTEELEKIRKEFERVELEKDNEIDRWRKEENEKDEVEHLRKEIDKNIQKDRQVENEMLRKEVINLKIELERLETDKQSEIDRLNRMKQTEIENIEKKRKAEVEKLKKDKQNEVERVVTEKEEELMMFKMAKEEEIAKLKKGKGVADADLLSKVRDRLNTSTDGADLNRTLENKVAMSKVVWLEEHRATRQAAIENAVRLAETELKMKMEEDLKNKTEARLEEAKEQWQNDSLSMLEEERRAWDSSKEEEISACLESERQKWARELEQRLEEEKQSWREFELETEKLKWASDFERKLEQEKEGWVRNMLEPAKRKWKHDFEEKLRMEKENWRCIELETEKLSLLQEYEKRLAMEKQSWINKILPEALEKEKRIWKAHTEDVLRKNQEKWRTVDLPKEMEKVKSQCLKEFETQLQSEHDRWRETEMVREVEAEREKWYKEIEGRLREERNNWKNCDLPEEIEKERKKWMKLMEQTLQKEKENWKTKDMPEQVQRVRQDLEAEMENRLVQKLGTEKDRLQKVTMAVEESREDWNREYMMEMSINTTSAEASQGLLKEEIENLKHQLQIVQSELQDKEKAWLKEREDIFLQKDLERRRDLENQQTKTEAEYRQFLDEHKDTLDKALKAAREQHNQDKAELEGRFDNQLKLLQVREKSLQQQLQQALDGSEDHHENLAELEKERIMWFDERDRLLQDIADRDSLLGKADVHLSKEVDKLRSELQAAYQRRLEAEMTSFRQKMESEYARVNNSEQKEKLLLEKQLSEINTELNKLKNQLHDERTKHGDEMKDMKQKLNEIEKKLEDHSRLEGELMKAKELLKGYKDELTDHQEKIEKLKSEKEELTVKLNKTSQSLDKHQTELQTKSSTLENMEASFRKDLSAYKHKLEEANNRIIKTEKHLHEMKLKYRTELESLRKALEAENDTAMNAMKNKMIELQKKHVEIVDQLKKKHLAEREQYMKGQAVSRGVTPTPNMHGDVEEIDQAVKELRSQYLDTVAKIKDDVLRHITETNVRAAETVKFEMDRERMTTFQQIKEFYRQNVRTILETELVGATLESKLLAVEEALDQLSSNPSSRSTTPKSDEFILDERQLKSRSRSASRDAGISPKGQRSVSFTSGTKGERSHTPVLNSGKDLNASLGFEDPRSPKNRIFTKSPRDGNVTLRGEHINDNSDLWASEDWKNESMKSGSFDTRKPENRPTSARSARENRDFDTRVRENRPLSAKSPRELHMSLRQRGSEYDYNESELDRSRSDKRRSRTLISTRDIHSGRYNKSAEGEETIEDRLRYNGDSRSKSTTPMYSSLARSSPSLYRPTSVPDLSCEDKELKIWTETNNDTYRYTPLRDTLRSGTNLHRNNSKSESDLSIADKNFAPMKGEYDSNLDLSSGSLTSDAFLTPRKARDAGETPTSTPRRHYHRKHYTLHSFPTRDQISSELRNREQSTNSDLRNQEQSQGNDPTNASFNLARNNENGVNSPIAGRTSRKNLPLIQFRQGKVQGLTKMPVTSSKSPHPEDGVMMRDTPPTRDNNGMQDRPYRPLSVSSTPHMNF